MTVICPTFFLESGTFFREYLLLLQFDDFLYLFFKVWSKDFLAYAFFDFINAPETSSVQLVTGMYFTVVDRFVYEDQFLLAGRLEDIMQDGFGNKVGNAEFFAYLAFQRHLYTFT